MKVDRRHFIAAGLGGISSACYPFFDPTTPWMSVQIPGLVGVTIDESKHGMHVLMVDAEAAGKVIDGATQPKDGSGNGGHFHFQKHFPRLIVNQKSFDLAKSSAPDGKLKDAFGQMSLVYWDLTGYQVTFPSGHDEKVIRVKTLRKRGDNETKPTIGTFGDPSWIPQMQRLTHTGKSRVNPACLGSDPRSAYVAARAYFGGGRLSSFYPARATPFDQVAFDFLPKPPRGAYKQVLGMPRLIHQIPSGTVTVDFQPFDSSKPRKTVTLLADATERRLDVQVKNEPDPDDPSFVHCSGDESRILRHFAALYTLLDPRDRVDYGSLPIPNGDKKDIPDCGAQTDVVVWCPGGDF